MRDVREYWRQVRELEASLEPFVWLAKGGAVTEVPARIAAPLLQAGLQRMATDGEIAGERARGQATALEAKHDCLRRTGKAIVVVPPTSASEAEAKQPEPTAPRRRR